MKSYYRSRLRIMKKYVKLSVLAKEYGISKSTLSMFMKDDNYNYYMSEELLKNFIDFVESKITHLT